MLVTLLPKATLVRPVQLEKALVPMLQTLSGIVTLVTADLLWNAPVPIALTGRPLVSLGMRTPTSEPVYPVIVMAPVLVVKVNWACTTAGSANSESNDSSPLKDVFIPYSNFREKAQHALFPCVLFYASDGNLARRNGTCWLCRRRTPEAEHLFPRARRLGISNSEARIPRVERRPKARILESRSAASAGRTKWRRRRDDHPGDAPQAMAAAAARPSAFFRLSGIVMSSLRPLGGSNQARYPSPELDSPSIGPRLVLDWSSIVARLLASAVARSGGLSAALPTGLDRAGSSGIQGGWCPFPKPGHHGGG